MTNNGKNRMSDSERKRGRPKKDTKKNPEEKAEVVAHNEPVPAIRCPGCGRGMVPRVKRTTANGRVCQCGLCGRLMEIKGRTNPTVRLL